VGALLYAAIVIVVNNKILQDSNSLTWFAVLVNLLSSGSFFIMFAIVSQL
jgi:hypothetical protein